AVDPRAHACRSAAAAALGAARPGDCGRHTAGLAHNFTDANSSLPIAIEPAAGVDALYAPRQTVIDPILAHAAAEAGAEVRVGLRVTHLNRTPPGRPSRVTGVDAMDAHSQSRQGSWSVRTESTLRSRDWLGRPSST